MYNLAKLARAPIAQAIVTRPSRMTPLLPSHAFSTRSCGSQLWIPRSPCTSSAVSRRRTSNEAPPQKTASVPISPERKAWRAAPHRRPDEPVYEIYFTCKVCKQRSGHSISKQGYHHGTILVQCPGCHNRHLISDHLKIFYDKGMTLEDIMKDKGENVSLGSLDQQGDVEFWDEAAVDAAQTQSEPSTKT